MASSIVLSANKAIVLSDVLGTSMLKSSRDSPVTHQRVCPSTQSTHLHVWCRLFVLLNTILAVNNINLEPQILFYKSGLNAKLYQTSAGLLKRLWKRRCHIQALFRLHLLSYRFYRLSHGCYGRWTDSLEIT